MGHHRGSFSCFPLSCLCKYPSPLLWELAARCCSCCCCCCLWYCIALPISNTIYTVHGLFQISISIVLLLYRTGAKQCRQRVSSSADCRLRIYSYFCQLQLRLLGNMHNIVVEYLVGNFRWKLFTCRGIERDISTARGRLACCVVLSVVAGS